MAISGLTSRQRGLKITPKISACSSAQLELSPDGSSSSTTAMMPIKTRTVKIIASVF
jgi:hypothetical protein